MSASRGWGGGGECYIFLVGNLAMHLCNPRIFLAENRARNGVVIVVAFKNLFTLGTCFQVVFKYFIAQGFSDRSAQFL